MIKNNECWITPKIVQISTGTYTYKDYNGNVLTSHAVYGLCEDFKVWKWIPSKYTWVPIDKIENNHNE